MNFPTSTVTSFEGQSYINQRTDDPRGTGGTPYMKWLGQLIDETLSHMIQVLAVHVHIPTSSQRCES